MMRYKVQTLLFLFFLGIFSKVSSQSVYDIVKYSTTELNGSARYQALGGAFGALGGDLSSISNNPAGSTIFNYNEGSATIGVNVFSPESMLLFKFVSKVFSSSPKEIGISKTSSC